MKTYRCIAVLLLLAICLGNCEDINSCPNGKIADWNVDFDNSPENLSGVFDHDVDGGWHIFSSTWDIPNICPDALLFVNLKFINRHITEDDDLHLFIKREGKQEYIPEKVSFGRYENITTCSFMEVAGRKNEPVTLTVLIQYYIPVRPDELPPDDLLTEGFRRCMIDVSYTTYK